MNITDKAPGVIFNDKGELVIPAIEDVPAADIKYRFRGVDVVLGQRLVIGETVEALEATTVYLKNEWNELRAENEVLTCRVTTLTSELEALKLGAFSSSKFALHPLQRTPENPEGVEVPDKGTSPKGVIIIMPDKRPWALRASFPVSSGEGIAFGGRKKTGFFVQVTCVARRSAIPGNPDEIGYEVLLSGLVGGRIIELRCYFVLRDEFFNSLPTKDGWRLKAEGRSEELVFMGGFDDPHIALKALEDNAAEELYIEKGWVPPKGHRKHARAIARVAEQIQSGGLPSGAASHQLESGPRNGANRHDEDRVETQKLQAARPPAPPPAAIAASVSGTKTNSTPPPKGPATSPDPDPAELTLLEEEVSVPVGEPEGSQPPAVAAPTN